MNKDDIEQVEKILKGLKDLPLDKIVEQLGKLSQADMDIVSQADTLGRAVDFLVTRGQKEWQSADETMTLDIPVPKQVKEFFYSLAKAPGAQGVTSQGVSIHWQFRSRVFSYLVMRGLYARAMEMKAETKPQERG